MIVTDTEFLTVEVAIEVLKRRRSWLAALDTPGANLEHLTRNRDGRAVEIRALDVALAALRRQVIRGARTK